MTRAERLSQKRQDEKAGLTRTAYERRLQWEATLRELRQLRFVDGFNRFVPRMVQARLYKTDERLF